MARVVAAILAVALVLSGCSSVVKADYDPSLALQMVYMAGAAYCSEQSVVDWDCEICGWAQPFNTTRYLYDSSLNVAGYVGYLAEDPSTAIVSFRGTMPSSLQDWIDNLETSFTRDPYDKCPGCEVHHGFLMSYESLSAAMLAEVKILQPKTVITTGHSLGAAMAALASVDLISQNYNVVSYTMGQPRVGNPAFATAFDNTIGPVENYRLVHYKDIVPHLPTEFMGFHHVATEVWYNEASSSFKVCNGSGEDPSCSDSLDFPISVSDHLDYLNVHLSRSCGSGNDD